MSTNRGSLHGTARDAPSRPRVRRGNREDAAQMRQELLAAAMQLFAEGGIDAVVVRTIAARVGVSPMTPYRYFPSRGDFLLGLWVHVLGALDEHLSQAIRSEVGPRAQHLRLVEAYLGYWEDHPSQFELIFRTQGPAPGPLADRDRLPAEYQHLLAMARTVTIDLAREIGAGMDRVDIACDLRLAMLFGYLQAVMVNQRHPWSDLAALKALYVKAVLHAVECCLRGEAASPTLLPVASLIRPVKRRKIKVAG